MTKGISLPLILLIAAFWTIGTATGCSSGQQWSNILVACVPNCSIIPHALPAINDISGCPCDVGFLWAGTSCTIDCAKINNTVGNQSTDSCRCSDNYAWNATSQLCEASQPQIFDSFDSFASDTHKAWIAGVVVSAVIVGGLIIAGLVVLIMWCSCPERFKPQNPYLAGRGNSYPQSPMSPRYPPVQNPYVPQYPGASIPPPRPPPQVQQAAVNMGYPQMGSQLYGSTF